jgi:hypothetical protein
VWRTRHPGMTARDATDLVVSVVWTGLGAVLPPSG